MPNWKTITFCSPVSMTWPAIVVVVTHWVKATVWELLSSEEQKIALRKLELTRAQHGIAWQNFLKD